MARNTFEVKICEHCKQPYQRRETHSDASWQAKMYCDRNCKDAAQAARYHEKKLEKPKPKPTHSNEINHGIYAWLYQPL